jgi:hypothetical protein
MHRRCLGSRTSRSQARPPHRPQKPNREVCYRPAWETGSSCARGGDGADGWACRARHRECPLQGDDKTPTQRCVTKTSDSAKLPVLEASLTLCIASSASCPVSTASARTPTPPARSIRRPAAIAGSRAPAEIDLLLGHDDRHRPLPQLLPLPMQRHAFRGCHPHCHTVRNTVTFPKRRFRNAVSRAETPFHRSLRRPRLVVQPIGRAQLPAHNELLLDRQRRVNTGGDAVTRPPAAAGDFC